MFPASRINARIRRTFYLPVGQMEPSCIDLDSMLALSLWMAGYSKVVTVVNRLYHIGEEGYGTNIIPDQSSQLGISRIKLDIFDEDRDITFLKRVEQ